MPESENSISGLSRQAQSRAAPVLTFVYLLFALGIFLITPILFLRALQTPFIGSFYEHTLMLNTAQPTQPGAWGKHFDLPFGYQVVALDGIKTENIQQLRDQLSRYAVEETIEITLQSPGAGMQSFSVTLLRLPVADRLSYFVIPYMTGLIYLVCGLYVFTVRRFDPAGRAFAVFAVSVAVTLATLFDLYTTNYLVAIWTVTLAVAGGALFNLALVFPEPVRKVVQYPFMGWLGYGVAILLVLYSLATLYNYTNPTAYVLAWRLEFIFLGLAAFTFIAFVAAAWFKAASPVVREQARVIFWGALFSFTPIGIWFLITSVLPATVVFSSWLLLPLGFFPAFTGYALIRYRLLSTDYLLSRTVAYALLTVLAVGGYALLVAGLSMVFGEFLQPSSPIVIGLMVFLLAIGLNPTRSYIQGVVDRYFFRGQTVYQETQQAFARELPQAMELSSILGLLRKYVDQAIMPSQNHIFVYDPLIAHYVASKTKSSAATSDVRFPVNSALIKALSSRRESLFLTDLSELPDALQVDKARLALLGASLYVPLPGRQQLLGWLALGPRISGEPYSSYGLRFLEALCDQAALAIERAQVVADLERRVREMNVLARVAQGASFTVAFDDILELVYAQTAQILPARDFRVTLHDDETDIISHAFFLEKDDRQPERENLPLPVGQGLEELVIKSQRPLVTDDYERECRGRGLLPSAQGLYAWMGVPLNAGARTIGVISVGSSDPAVVYTEEQLNLLQAIADQASGAIVKARLLEESERRARQLTSLNEVGISLTSTLEVKTLMQQILESATDILNCEAGSLFLVDPETDELVFEVVIGPVADDLLGRRLPPGTGLVGEAVNTGKALIANDARRRKQWHKQTDQQTGFETQDLLVVPMRVQDLVIGVIEVINKADGAPFTEADQELLMAFTSQATIAIDNARLYTMTDQALAARVEELSVMQRIDRELNASLDIDRAMRITLAWALRQSRAEAGLVGTVDNGSLRVMTAEGYEDEIYQGKAADENRYPYLQTDLPGLKAAIESGHPQLMLASEGSTPDRFSIKADALSQIVIPIRRETNTIGVVLLESTADETPSEETLGFLTRLSDHAAIAIANAQLYEEVIEANLAKSQFVSFVAHELKNPMSSIKGYTELISGGMAGPVNDMQSGFLVTIRSNVDRMNTIVTDLNDLTKIQVGNLRLEFEAVRVQDILEEVIRSISRQLEEHGQELILKLPDDLPPVWADSSRLTQVLTNLVSNGQKYTPESGRITVGAERFIPLDDDTLAGLEFVRIWVQDTGIGISEEDQEKIFQQYFRTDSAKEMASGTGLGLVIAKNLVEMQGGRIWFESTLDEGTIFHVTIPVAEAN